MEGRIVERFYFRILLGVKLTSRRNCLAFQAIKLTLSKLTYFDFEIELFYRYITGAHGSKQFAY